MPPGDPAALCEAAADLRRTVADFDVFAGAIGREGRAMLADGEWEGRAADLFSSRVIRLTGRAERLSPALVSMAATLEAYAA